MGKLFHAKLPAGREGRQWNNKAKANGGFGPFADEKHQLSGKFFSVQEWDGPDRDFPDVKSADAAINFLKNRDSTKPFFMVYGLWRPHNPWTAPRRFFERYNLAEIAFPPPGYSADDLDDLPSPGRELAAIYKERWNAHGDRSAEEWKRVFHGYLACTSFADWNLGRVIDALDRTKLAENTIVIMTSDNGYHVGEKHHYGKSTLWGKSANVPLMIRLTGGKNAGTKTDATVGLIDLYPTLSSVCGLPNTSHQLDGRDISPLLDDPTTDWKHPAITTYGEIKFSLRSGQWRYIRYPDGTEELYDHSLDPHEFNNIASQLELESTKSQVPKLHSDDIQEVVGWPKRIGDQNLLMFLNSFLTILPYEVSIFTATACRFDAA